MRSCIKCNQQIGSCTSHFVAHCSVCPGMKCHQDEIQCCFCDFSAEREALRRHLWEHEALSQITCIYCEQNVPYQMNILLEHCRTLCPCMSHNDESHTYVCFGCAYHTYWTTNMRRHIKLKHRPEVHTFEKTFHCEYCRFRTEKQKLMDLHKAKRHGHNMIDVAKLKDVVVLDATDNVRKRRGKDELGESKN